MTIELRVLGGMELGPETESIALGGGKQRGALAMLVAQFPRVVGIDALVEALWSRGTLPEQPRRTVQLYVSNLRKALRTRSIDIAGAGDGYQLVAERSQIDLAAFEDLVATADRQRATDPRAALESYRRADGLWRGRPFLGIDIDELDRAADRIIEQRVAADESRQGLEITYGQRPAAIRALRLLVEEHPHREAAALHLATGLYLERRHPEALDVLTELRERLRDLGLEPSPSLGDLELQILRHKLDDAGLIVEPAGAVGEAPLRLPRVGSRFVGREAELEELSRACRASRWVTLIGPGGVGKTRLAIEAADTIGRPAYFIGLASTDANGVVPTLVDVLGLAVVPGVTLGHLVEVCVDRFRDTEVLVVVDNAEHVNERVVEVFGALVRGVAGMSVLVTSRDVLHATGERTMQLGPLADDDAADLFADRSGLAGRVVDVSSPQVADQVQRVCRTLDNLPLAIEVAATRTRVLQLPELVERVEDRFALLASQLHGELANHRTLRGTIEWSYDRLSPDEQTMFDRLTMFPAGCTLETAEAVCVVEGDPFARQDVVDVLARLVDRSMLIADQRSVPTRFRMLETLRQFGSERLDASPRVALAQEALGRWALGVVIDAYFDALGAQPDRGRRVLNAEVDNIRVAFETAVAADRPEALEIANWIAYLRMVRGEFALGLDWLLRARPIGGDVPSRSEIAASRAYADIWIRHYYLMVEGRDAHGSGDDALDVLRETASGERLGSALLLAAATEISMLGDSKRALELTDEVAARFDPASDRLVWARRDGLAAQAHFRLGELDRAEALAEASTNALLDLPSEVAAFHPMLTLVVIAWRRGESERVRELSERLASMQERLEHVAYQHDGRYWLAALATGASDHDTAVRLVEAELARPSVFAARQAVVALRSLLFRRAGDLDASARLLRQSMPGVVRPYSVEGAAILAERGWCELALGDLRSAEDFFDQSLAYGDRVNDPVSRAAGLEGRSAIALARGDHDAARRHLAEATGIRLDAPARSNLHEAEVEELRRSLS